MTTFPPPSKSQYYSYGDTYSLSVAILPCVTTKLKAKIHHKEKETNSRVKEEGKEEDDCIYEDNGFFQDDDDYPQFNHAPMVDKPPNPTNAPNTSPNTTFTLRIHPPPMPTLLPALPVILPKNKEQNVGSVHFLITIIRLKYANGP
jgi:hypothetical protein